jgi:hypothetical protein
LNFGVQLRRRRSHTSILVLAVVEAAGGGSDSAKSGNVRGRHEVLGSRGRGASAHEFGWRKNSGVALVAQVERISDDGTGALLLPVVVLRHSEGSAAVEANVAEEISENE